MHPSVKTSRLNLQLTCRLASTVDVTLHDFFTPIQTDKIIALEDESASFNVEMSLFTDAAMLTPVGVGHEVTVPDPLFAKLEVIEDLNKFTLKMQECWATPTEDPADESAYQIVVNYDANPAETAFLEVMQNCVDDIAKFKVDSFMFSNSPKVFIHCKVNICDHTQDECSCGAAQEASRRRRSIDTSNDNVVSVGPIGIKV